MTPPAANSSAPSSASNPMGTPPNCGRRGTFCPTWKWRWAMRSPRRRPASAVESYLAYRRDGGENQDVVADLCDRVAQAVAEGDTVEAEQTLAEYLTPNANQRTKTIIPKFQAILAGSRDLAMA